MARDIEHRVDCGCLRITHRRRGQFPLIIPVCNWEGSGANYKVSQIQPGSGGVDFWGNCRDCEMNTWSEKADTPSR
jgi:hypothetical protein